MGIFPLQPFNESGQLRGEGARPAAILAWLGTQGFEAAVAVALGTRPFLQ